MKPLQFGFIKIASEEPTLKGSKIEEKLEEIMLTLEGTFVLKSYTEINNIKSLKTC